MIRPIEWRSTDDRSHVLFDMRPSGDMAIAKITSFRGRSFMCVIFDTQEVKDFSCFDSLSYLSSTWSKWRSERTLNKCKKWCEDKTLASSRI